jgi:hypothetical protein
MQRGRHAFPFIFLFLWVQKIQGICAAVGAHATLAPFSFHPIFSALQFSKISSSTICT